VVTGIEPTTSGLFDHLNIGMNRLKQHPVWFYLDLSKVKKIAVEALNDDLSSKVDDRINERDKQLLNCPINDPDTILASTGRSWDDLV